MTSADQSQQNDLDPMTHYSRRMKPEKYLEMQELILRIANGEPHLEIDRIKQLALNLVGGMVQPRGPAVRAMERSRQLDMLALAYRIASGVFPGESPHLQEARTLLVEALKAWERANPPPPLDPLLL